MGLGEQAVVGEVGLTPRARKVVELAVDEARRLDHNYIGTEHLLLGIIRERESIAAGILDSLGINLERVRIAVLDALTLQRLLKEEEARNEMTSQPLQHNEEVAIDESKLPEMEEAQIPTTDENSTPD